MTTSGPSAAAIIEALDHRWPAGTPVTTSEVATEFEYPTQTVRNKLESLADDGSVKTKAVGDNGRIWWRPVESEQNRDTNAGKGRPQVRSHPVFDSELVGVIVWGDDVTIEDANDAFLEMVGLDYEEALGTSWRELTPEEFYPVSERHVLEVEERGSGVPYEKQYYHADGSRWWGLFESRQLNDTEKIEFVVEITERKQYEQTLEQQNDQLERLKKFTDALSHDLRSPLSVINNRLHLYRDTSEPEHLDAIQITTERMERLVDDLLRVAHSGRVVEEAKPTRIGDILETAREGVLPDSASCEYETVETVLAESDRLVQVFGNLMENSVDHGGEGVTIRVGPLDNGFYVEDDGPGVPEADRGRMFEHGFTTREDGMGYGLSIVYSIVDAHGWDITLTESEDGGGARFEITGVDFADEQ